MNACASVAAVRVPAAAPLDRPVVLLDGVIEPGLSVERIESAGPLDTRRAVLRVSDAYPHVRHWIVARPLRLVDDRVRWRVLVAGHHPRRVDADRVELDDAWTDALIRAVTPAAVGRDGRPVTQSGGLLAATRSDGRYLIGERSVHVLQRRGLPWTVRDALESIAAFAGICLNLRGLPAAIAGAPLVAPIDLALPLRSVLLQVIEPYGLIVTRDLSLDGATLIERMAVRPAPRGRRVRARWTRPDQPIGEVLRVTRNKPLPGSQLWVAETRGPIVESTFELVGGWDPALEGESSDTYDRALSADFAAFANVYRRWVLNEDGFYTGAPYERGPAFDLAALFDREPIAPTPLPFLDCVTLDDAGGARDPIVEYSVDAGATWSRWAGRVRVLDDRAGVYLDDATLPGAYLDAALADAARVRVTAALRSPLPVRVRRWKGNPFAGVRPPRRLDLSRLFVFKRIAPGSVHYADVQNGTLTADVRDPSTDMQRWLVDRMWRDGLTPASLEGEATLRLLDGGVVSPGDVLLDAGGAGRDLDGQAQALRRQGGMVAKVIEDVDCAVTTVTLRY